MSPLKHSHWHPRFSSISAGVQILREFGLLLIICNWYFIYLGAFKRVASLHKLYWGGSTLSVVSVHSVTHCTTYITNNISKGRSSSLKIVPLGPCFEVLESLSLCILLLDLILQKFRIWSAKYFGDGHKWVSQTRRCKRGWCYKIATPV